MPKVGEIYSLRWDGGPSARDSDATIVRANPDHISVYWHNIGVEQDITIGVFNFWMSDKPKSFEFKLNESAKVKSILERYE
jgi:hypothetical protein